MHAESAQKGNNSPAKSKGNGKGTNKSTGTSKDINSVIRKQQRILMMSLRKQEEMSAFMRQLFVVILAIQRIIGIFILSVDALC